ncbi:hypothetical protein [Desulfovibrio litoralis]|uniref:Uncharacterized protein n=1 Tax=Desulfovibrio litoralis DSM 11393 TaxID=1121455 RepID=A0A1M7SBG8_9BACT|nr:hypothetical protein [Desulfovibrio litoralis]SHN55592.1 hypothetical protein SAMN02745728_00693 [Desulfovibrio litoralis DSM 11393]
MPQVAARISSDQEKWLKDYFRTKSAGAEFILPWAVDTFFRATALIKGFFSSAELKTIVEAHKDIRLSPDQTKLSYLLLRLSDSCKNNQIHLKHGASYETLEAKIKELDDTAAAALMIWAAAFWVSKNNSNENLEDYVKC